MREFPMQASYPQNHCATTLQCILNQKLTVGTGKIKEMKNKTKAAENEDYMCLQKV